MSAFFILLHLALNLRKYSRETFGSVHLLLKQNGFERRKQASNDSLIKIQSVSVLRNEKHDFLVSFLLLCFYYWLDMTEQEGCIKIIHHHTRTIVVYNHNKVSVTHMLVSGNKKSIRTSVCATPYTQTSHTSCMNWNEENKVPHIPQRWLVANRWRHLPFFWWRHRCAPITSHITVSGIRNRGSSVAS